MLAQQGRGSDEAVETIICNYVKVMLWVVGGLLVGMLVEHLLCSAQAGL